MREMRVHAVNLPIFVNGCDDCVNGHSHRADGNCGPRSAVGLVVYDLQVITDRARDAVVNTNDPHHVYVTHNVNDSSATADTAQLRNPKAQEA